MQSSCGRFLQFAVIGVLVALPFAGALAAPGASGGTAAHVDESQPNEAALRAIVQHWGDAEVEGDVAYLERLLAPEYRSVDPKGGSHPRARIIEHARKSNGSEEARKARDAYMKAHPTDMAVVIRGELGVVSYFDPKRGVDSSIRSSDVFVYEDHHWRAVISMHNSSE